MYQWLVFLHVLGVFGFLLAHGASVGAAFALRNERNLERARALLLQSASTYPIMYLSLLTLVVSGIITGVMGNWWGRGWIWASLILLVAIFVAMTLFGSRVYGGVRKAIGLPYYDSGKIHPPVEPLAAQEIDALLAKGNPMLLTVVGYGGIAVVAWLMMFKPF